MKKVLCFLLALLLFCLAGCGKTDSEPLLQETPLQEGEEIAVMETSMGTIKIRFFPEQAPLAVENFLTLAKEGFYNNVSFHRVIADFMIQGGDPTGTGTGGPGWTIPGEFAANGFKNDLKHERGVLSWARTSDPDSAGSQFFIMVDDAPYLDGQYAAFGRLTAGLDVVDQIVAGLHGRTPVMKTVTIEK